jgi:hypothetical protein
MARIDSCGQITKDSIKLDLGKYVTIRAKVFLQGAYLNATGAMNDELRQNNFIPLVEPYSTLNGFKHKNGGGLEKTTLNVLTNNQYPTVVDWLFLELRDANLPSNILTTRAALVLQNGNIVDADGVSLVTFSNSDSAYYHIAIRHRNHLGMSTLNPILLSKIVTNLDFTNNTILLNGVNASTNLNAQTMGMISEDAISDGSIDSFDASIWEFQNGSFDNYLNNADYNFDGSVDSLDSVLWEDNNGKYDELD